MGLVKPMGTDAAADADIRKEAGQVRITIVIQKSGPRADNRKLSNKICENRQL